MVEIPEHLLKRSREAMARAKAKKGEAPPPEEPEPAEAAAPSQAPEAEQAAEQAVDETGAGAEAESAAPAEAAVGGEPEAEAAAGEGTQAVGVSAGATGVLGGAPSLPYLPDELADAGGGIKEVVTSKAPGWLVAVFVLVPLISLIYMTQFSQGTQCGQAGTMQIGSDGQLQTCDGKPLPSPGTAAAKRQAPDGKAIFAQRCAACHGANGEGGVGPPLNKGSGTTLLEDFPDAASQIEFVTKGSQAFPDGWGAKKRKPSANAMPAFGNTLSQEEIEAVVKYERSLAGEQTG
jgi:mono/diheme cytochrome c family protein